jgi:hypothetical protein
LRSSVTTVKAVKPVLFVSQRAPCSFHSPKALDRRISVGLFREFGTVVRVLSKDIWLLHWHNPLLPLVLKKRDFALLLPQLYVVAINKLLGFFFCGGVILANHIDRPKDMAVRADKVCTV